MQYAMYLIHCILLSMCVDQILFQMSEEFLFRLAFQGFRYQELYFLRDTQVGFSDPIWDQGNELGLSRILESLGIQDV